MEILDLRQDIPRDPVGQVLTYDGRSIALVDLGRDASDALRASWPTVRPFQSGGVIESAWMLPMLGVGSTTASSLFAGNVFLATANPATLMTIGTGVGSAVMGPTGIVAAAPFVAASSALMPVVAPMMLFTTLSSLMMSARLDRVQRTLGRLFEVVRERSSPPGRRRLRPVRDCSGTDRRNPIRIRAVPAIRQRRAGQAVEGRAPCEPAAFQVRTPDDRRRSIGGRRSVVGVGSQSVLLGKSLRHSGRPAPVVLGAPGRS